MDVVRAVNAEPIPGYRLLEPLGKGGFGEVWKCQAPGGLFKAIKFVRGSDDLDQANSGAAQELRALEHVKSLRHPFLLSIERVEVVGGDLLIVTELADRSLHDLLVQYRQGDRPGIPRGEVLTYLREAAEVLDFLNHEHDLQHLDIKPRNLFLVGKHVKVADFGLVASLAELRTRDDILGGVTPVYAAPEVFDGRPTLFSDQYSLAVTYHELVTGASLFEARNFCQLALLVATTAPDLSRLPAADQPIVAQALSKGPRQRFPSCSGFVEALIAASPAGSMKARTTSFELSLGDMEATAVVPVARPSGVVRRDSRLVPTVQPAERPASSEPLPGFQLQECLSRGQIGELWRARGPQGDARLVRFLAPLEAGSPAAEGLDRLLALNHPSLAEVEIHPVGPERFALVSEAGESSLANRLRECREAMHPGIDRRELLGHLAPVAQALDEIYDEDQLQHLALSPRHVALCRNEAILLEFGQTELLWLPQGVQPAALNPRYSALELFEGMITDSCDQYSLALMFQELLVGIHPYRNLNARQMASSRLRGQPDLSLLPGPDRPIVTKALDPVPERRFRSCREFIQALEEGTFQADHDTVTVSASQSPTRVGLPTSGVQAQAADPILASWKPAFEELVNAASRGHQVQVSGQVYYRHAPGVSIEHRAWARLPSGMARLKLTGFREQWQGDVLSHSGSRWRLAIKTTANLWQRCLGRSPSLCVEVLLGQSKGSAASLTPVRVLIEPIDCSRSRAVQVLADLGPNLLQSLQTYLNSQSEERDQERYPLSQQVQIQAPAAGQTLTGRLRDVGRQGLCLHVTSPLPNGAVTVTMNRWASPLTMQVPGWVRDCTPDEDGQYEVEVAF